MYNIPSDWLFKRTNNMNPEYMACHFPGYPIVIRIFSFLCFNNYVLGSLLAITFTSYLSVFVFRRLLIVYDLVKDPGYTSFLSIFVPLRFLNYKVVGASEPLYVSVVFLALIFFRTEQLFPMLFCLIYATITRIEGLSIVGTIGLCYLLKFDIIRAIFSGFGAIGTIAVFYSHYVFFNNVHAYFDHNKNQHDLIGIPFMDFVEMGFYSAYMQQKLLLETVVIAGLCDMWTKSVPLAIFVFVYFVYVGALKHPDLFRYGIPSYMPCLLIGFDFVWSHPLVKDNIKTITIVYIVIALIYINGQIVSNIMDKEIYAQVVNSSMPY